MMSDPVEWDFPPTKHHRRRPRIEVMPPQRAAHVRITVQRHHSGPSPVLIVAIVVGLLILLRTGFGPFVISRRSWGCCRIDTR